MTDDPRRAFLELFDAPRRSTVANLFLHAVRRGASDPGSVLRAVTETVGARRLVAERYGNADALEKAREIVEALTSHLDEAAAFAEWCFEWEALPTGERQAVKEARAQEGIRAWRAEQPATPAQLSYLAALGHRGPVGSRQRASELIDELRRRPREVS